jgi:transcriptional regulator with XRE-family HTH domain
MENIITRQNAGEKLLELIAERNISQADISKKTGIAESTISEIINGKRLANITTAFKLNKFANEMV